MKTWRNRPDDASDTLSVNGFNRNYSLGSLEGPFIAINNLQSADANRATAVALASRKNLVSRAWIVAAPQRSD